MSGEDQINPLTIIIVSYDMRILDKFADKKIHLDCGEIMDDNA
jgi:ABC-type glutathione transport system ATPase component